MKTSIDHSQRVSVSPLKRHFDLTKYVITLFLLIGVVLNGLTGYQFFRNSNYDMSSLLVIASYLSIVMSIYMLTVAKRNSAVK